MGCSWSVDGDDDIEISLTSFPFLLLDNDLHDDNSLLMDIGDKSIDVHPTFSKEAATKFDIYVDLPIELEHSANHVYDDDLETFDHTLDVCEDSSTYKDEAMCSPQKGQWKEAMEAKYEYLVLKGT